MKTKTIEVWVDSDWCKHGGNNESTIVTNYRASNGDTPYLNAKLIIEIPEKSIAITEDQLDDIWNSIIHDGKSLGLIHALKIRLGF